MSAPGRHRRRQFDIWPGFVDALTSLIMVMIFLLLLFAIGQFVLSDALAGKSRTLATLNLRLDELGRQAAMSEAERKAAAARVAELLARMGLVTEERDQLKSRMDEQNERLTALNNDILALDALRRQLEEQVTQLASRLNAADQNNQGKDLRIADLDRQLKLALASRANELEKYRSEFFGKLREALGNREDVRIVGDRFLLPSDILFSSGSAELGSDAQARLGKLVNTIRDVSQKIPDSIDWVLRIDGHTDRVPIATDKFPSNWELSTARAVAIVKWMTGQGIPARHLSANGFAQYQPVDPGESPEALARNRRIEIQLTNR
ncbi:peptidoglycan -binding protein [Methyloparacoccus murrellii]